jgi:hypothetical protein
MVEKDSTWVTEHTRSSKPAYFLLWDIASPILRETARFASCQDCFPMTSKVECVWGCAFVFFHSEIRSQTERSIQYLGAQEELNLIIKLSTFVLQHTFCDENSLSNLEQGDHVYNRENLEPSTLF